MDKNILKQILSNDPIILDAGAYNGNDSIQFATLFPCSTIYSFEPVKYIYEILCNNVKDYKNIKTFNLALDDINNVKDMYISSGMSVQSSSLLKPKEHLTIFPTCAFERIEKVDTITINEFVARNNIDRIDFMWLDLQGNELKVLNEANNILHTTKGIFAEYSLIEFYEGLTLYNEFKSYMIDLGFEEIINEDYNNHIHCGNSLFIRKDKGI